MNRIPDEEVSRAIDLTVMCQTFNVLPHPGGLLEQDSYHIYMMQCVLVAQSEKAELDQKRSAAAR